MLYKLSIGLAVLCVAILLGTLQVNAHDWYSSSCCGGHDCHPITSCSEILEQANGWVSWEGNWFSPSQVHPSLDNQCHVCMHQYEVLKKPMCIYVQQGS